MAKSPLGQMFREIRQAVIDAGRHADAKLPDLPRLHAAQVRSMKRQIEARDRYDGGSGSGGTTASGHRPGNTPEGVRPYDGPNRNQEKGDFGEDVTDRYMRERGYERISHRNDSNGLDGVYANRSGEAMIVESKYNLSRLGWTSDGNGGRNRQMDTDWLIGHFNRRQGNRIREALSHDPELAEAAEDLFRSGDAPPVVSRILPDGSVELSLPRFHPDGTISESISLEF